MPFRLTRCSTRSPSPSLLLRRLRLADKAAAINLCEANPIDSVFIRQNIDNARLSLSGALGLFSTDTNQLVSLLWETGMAVPIGFSEHGLDIVADHVRRYKDVMTSFVGPRDQVMGLWQRIENDLGPAADIRDPQYSMVIDHAPSIDGDDSVRPARRDEENLIYPVAVRAFTEEVGYDPTTYGNSYMMRVRSLIRSGRTYIKLADGDDGKRRIVFKADVGALAGSVAQIQGVWVDPAMRGRGIGSAGLASMINQLRANPTIGHISLYVNHYNQPALRIYEKLGFRHASDWATVQL